MISRQGNVQDAGLFCRHSKSDDVAWPKNGFAIWNVTLSTICHLNMFLVESVLCSIGQEPMNVLEHLDYSSLLYLM